MGISVTVTSLIPVTVISVAHSTKVESLSYRHPVRGWDQTRVLLASIPNLGSLAL